MTGPLEQGLTSWHIDNRVDLLVLSLTPMMHRTPTGSANG